MTNKVKHIISGENVPYTPPVPTYLVKYVDDKPVTYANEPCFVGKYEDFTMDAQLRTGIDLGSIIVSPSSGLSKELKAQQILSYGIPDLVEPIDNPSDIVEPVTNVPSES